MTFGPSGLQTPIPAWLAANTTIDEYHGALELDGNGRPVNDGADATRLNLNDLGPQLAYYDALDFAASGLIAPLQPHDYSMPIFRSARGKIAMALVEDIVAPNVVRDCRLNPFQ